MLRTDLLSFGVTGAVFKTAAEMRQLPAYFDNPANATIDYKSILFGAKVCLDFTIVNSRVAGHPQESEKVSIGRAVCLLELLP